MNSVTAPSLARASRDKFRDLGGEIDETGARRLNRQQRGHDGVCADRDSASGRAISVRAMATSRRTDSDDRPPQILPVTSFCIRLAMSTSRRHACSRNDITRSMSRSLGSGISILRSPSATFGSGFFSEFALRQRFVDLAGDGRLARRQLGLELFIVGLQPADFRIERRAFVGHGIAGPAAAGIVAGRNRAGAGIEPDHAIGDRRQRIAAVLGIRHRLRRGGAAFRRGRNISRGGDG